MVFSFRRSARRLPAGPKRRAERCGFARPVWSRRQVSTARLRRGRGTSPASPPQSTACARRDTRVAAARRGVGPGRRRRHIAVPARRPRAVRLSPVSWIASGVQPSSVPPSSSTQRLRISSRWSNSGAITSVKSLWRRERAEGGLDIVRVTIGDLRDAHAGKPGEVRKRRLRAWPGLRAQTRARSTPPNSPEMYS